MSRSKINFDEEGLPIPIMEKSKVSFDEEGLPVPSKKKVGSVDYSKNSLSSSTSNPPSQSEGDIPTVDLGKSIPDNTVLGNMKPEEDESDIQSALNIGKLKGQGTYVAGGGTGGAGASFSIDPEASNKIVDLTGKLKQRGITQQHIDQIQQDFSDLPAKAKDVQITYPDGTVEHPYSIESFNKLLSTDPAAYKSRLNTAKIYLNLHDKNEQAGNEFSLLQFQNSSGDVNSDINKFQKQKAKQEEIIKNNLEGEQRNKALERLDENSSLWLNKEIPDSDEAAKYLTNKLYQSGKQDFNNPDLSSQSTEFTGNLNDVPLQEIESHLDPNNKADVVAFSKYKNKVDLDEAVNHSGNLDEAAINYTAAQDPKVAAQLEMTGGQLPNSYKAQLVVDFLNNPEVLKKAQNDPQFKDEYLKTQQNLYFNYPEYAKKVVGSKIAQAREDAGMNNWLVNVPSKESTDKLVSKLVDEGKLSPQDAAVYQKQIRDELGGWESTKRGVGRLVPFLQTQVDESPIPTPGFLESAENSYVNTLSNTAKSVKDVATLPSMVLGTDDSKRLYNSLSEQYSKAAMAPKGLLHQASEGAGNLTGFIIPMMVGGAALKGAKGGEFITNALMFEGQNRDAALNLFPDDPIKRYLYTNIATAGDVMLGHLLPVKDANEGVGKVFKNDIRDIITDLTNNKITQEEAKKTLLQKAADVAPELLKENAKTAGVMTGFGVFHNTLDALFGANDMSAGDIAYDAVKSFKTNFLSTPLLTAMSVYGKAGNNPKFNGKMLMEAADNPEGTRKTIEEQAVKSPSLEAQKDEMLTNLNDVVSIKKDLDKTSLTEPQKEKYLVEAINQKIWERKASETQDDKIKEKYLKKAAVHSENKQEILSDKDKAKEFQKYAKTQGVVVTPPDNMPESIPLKTEEQARTENGVTITPPLTTGESIPLGKETEQEMPNEVGKEPLQQAKDIINTTEIKGYSADPLKEAVKNGDDETLNKYLKNIAEQAHDEKSLPMIIDTYGNDLVDVAQKMFPNEKAKATEIPDTETQSSTTNTEPNQTGGETKEGTGGKEPPIEEPELVKNNEEDEDWAAVRKAKLKEISGVKEMIEKRQPKGWTQTFQNAAENVQKMFPKKSLYEAMKARVNELKLKLEAKELYNPTSEDNAVFTMLRAETHKRINDVEGQDSDNPIVRQAANMELESLHNDLMDIARVTNPEGETGRAFNILQSEAKFDKDNGLKIRRMQMIKAKGGEPLTPEENKWSSDQWEKEKDIMKQEQEVKEKAMQDEFDAKISELQKQYEKGKESKGKEDKPNDTVKKLGQRGKDIADQIRKLKIQKGDTALDVTFGLRNLAIEAVATLVEKGASIAEAIHEVLKDAKFKDITEKELTDHILDGLKNKKDKEIELDKIKSFAKENDVTDITKDMVDKNLIRDYVNSHIGEVDKKDVFNESFKDLKEVLPSITKDRFREAYLKEGEFKQPTKKALEGGIKQQETELKRIARSERSADQQQKVKLESEKENAVKKKKEFERKLADGEFEEPEPTKLKKKDAELIRLEKDKSVVEEGYRKKQKEFQEKNKHWLERAADFIRSSYVGLLIGHPLTLAKVTAMSVLRPTSEAVTKLTFGKVFDAFFPNISKAAKRGGESSSLRSIKKGFEAYFAQMGEKRIEAKYQKAEREYNEASKEYEDYKKTDNPDEKRLKQLENKKNDKLINSVGSFIYKFIGGSSIKDAYTALVHRSNEIERQFGKVEKESIKDGNALDKARYSLDFIGRSHSAAKTFSGRFSFAAGFMARLEGAVADGVDISQGDKILEIAHESYIDWERGKYQQSNAISDLWNKMVNNISKGETEDAKKNTGKAMETLLKGDVAITRVPVNILHESVMEYTLGAFRAAIMAKKAVKESKSSLIEEGVDINSPEFKDALKERISQMDETQAATIARAFRKGGLGAGLYALALISGAIHFGILPHLGQNKKKDEDKLKEGELNPGDIVVGDTKLNHNVAKIVEHIPAFWPMFMGLGMSQDYHDQINKGKTTKAAVAKSIFDHLQIIEGGIPQTQIISPSRVAGKVYDIGKKRLTDMGVINDDKSLFSQDEQNTPTVKYLKDKGIELKPPVQAQHKVDIDEKHPQGIMMPDEWDKFQKLRKDIIMKGIPERKENHKVVQEKVEGIDEILNTTYHVTTKDSRGRNHTKIVQGKDLTDEQLKSKIQSLQEKATEYANNKMGLKAEKQKTTVKKGI